MGKSKQLVITTREIIERERILSTEETEQVLIRARELAQKFPLIDFYEHCETAVFELMDKKYQDGLSQMPLDTVDADGEEMMSLSVKMQKGGYYSIRDFEEED